GENVPGQREALRAGGGRRGADQRLDWVAPDLAAALGETRHASGSGTGVTVADPGAITVNAGALAYGVSLVNGLFGLDTPPSPWTTLMTQGDLLMKGDGEYDAEFTVADAGGTVDPRWAW